jgi:ATP-dependent Lhr-like helicase
VLPARVAKYDPAWLDALCLSGEVVWGRLAPRDATKAPPRSAPVTLARRRDLAWLLAPRDHGDYREGAPPPPPPEADLSPPAASILASLTAAGASFFDDIVRMTGLPLAEVEDGIWELVAAGKVTGDGFAGLRALLVPPSKRVMSRRVHGDRYGFAAPLAVTGRWSLLRVPPLPPPSAAGAPSAAVAPSAAGAPAPDNLSAIEPLARQYLARYGVVLREIFAREASPPAWRDLLRVYRRLEARGEIRGGRFVAGLVGEQFALPEALDALRAIHRAPRRGDIVRLSACDPLNLAGILTPGPRVPAMTTGVVIFRDGIPLSDEEARVIAPPAAARKATPSRARHEGRATA